jgi:hypothetical protein
MMSHVLLVSKIGLVHDPTSRKHCAMAHAMAHAIFNASEISSNTFTLSWTAHRKDAMGLGTKFLVLVSHFALLVGHQCATTGAPLSQTLDDFCSTNLVKENGFSSDDGFLEPTDRNRVFDKPQLVDFNLGQTVHPRPCDYNSARAHSNSN